MSLRTLSHSRIVAMKVGFPGAAFNPPGRFLIPWARRLRANSWRDLARSMERRDRFAKKVSSACAQSDRRSARTGHPSASPTNRIASRLDAPRPSHSFVGYIETRDSRFERLPRSLFGHSRSSDAVRAEPKTLIERVALDESNLRPTDVFATTGAGTDKCPPPISQ